MPFDSTMFFQSWTVIARTLIVGSCAYVALVVLLRVSGNRTLSKLNAFDLIVTVALGSTLASVLTSKDVALVQGLAAFALLVGLQFVVTWTSVRSRTVDRLVKAEPVLLVHRGAYLERALRAARVTKDEVRAVLREHGKADVASVHAVVLESDGSMSVVTDAGPDAPALSNVEIRHPEEGRRRTHGAPSPSESPG